MKIRIENMKDKNKVHLRNVQFGHIFKWTYLLLYIQIATSEEAVF